MRVPRVKTQNLWVFIPGDERISLRTHGALKEHIVVWIAAFFHCPAELYAKRTRQHRIQRGADASGLPSEFVSQNPENLRFDFTATGDYIERSRRRSAVLRELKSRNPNDRI